MQLEQAGRARSQRSLQTSAKLPACDNGEKYFRLRHGMQEMGLRLLELRGAPSRSPWLRGPAIVSKQSKRSSDAFSKNSVDGYKRRSRFVKTMEMAK
jgi:hypothetical protein